MRGSTSTRPRIAIDIRIVGSIGRTGQTRDLGDGTRAASSSRPASIEPRASSPIKTASSVLRENLRSELPNTLVDRTVGMSGAHLTAWRLVCRDSKHHVFVRSVGESRARARLAPSTHALSCARLVSVSARRSEAMFPRRGRVSSSRLASKIGGGHSPAKRSQFHAVKFDLHLPRLISLQASMYLVTYKSVFFLIVDSS